MSTGQGRQRTTGPGPAVTFCKKTICQSSERKKGLSFTSWALWGDAGHPGYVRGWGRWPQPTPGSATFWLSDLGQVP